MSDRLSSPFRVNIKKIFILESTDSFKTAQRWGLVPVPFPFPLHGEGSRNEVDSMLFRSATSQAIYFFLFRMRSLILGQSVGKEKKKPKKKKLEKSRTRRSSI